MTEVRQILNDPTRKVKQRANPLRSWRLGMFAGGVVLVVAGAFASWRVGASVSVWVSF